MITGDENVFHPSGISGQAMASGSLVQHPENKRQIRYVDLPAK